MRAERTVKLLRTRGCPAVAPGPGTTLSSIAIRVDGLEIGNGATIPFTAPWDTQGLEKKSVHQIAAGITDAAGNVVQSIPVTVTIAQTGCGCGAVPGSEGTILFSLAVALQALRRRVSRRCGECRSRSSIAPTA